MRKSITTLLALTGLLGGVAVNAAVIDFDNDNPTYFGTTTWQQANFTVTSNAPDGTIVDNNNLVRANIGAFGIGNNTQSIFWGVNGQSDNTLTMTHDLGYGFNLLTFDASSLYNTTGTLTVTGYQANGGTVTQNVALTGALSLINVAGMTGLHTVEFSFDGSTQFAPFDLDNITVSLVPIPAAVWLMASGLGVLVATRRRKA